MRTLWRLIHFALQSITRNIWLSVATVTVLVLTLITVNGVIVLNVLADAAVRSVESRLSVDVYFNAGVSETTQANVRAYLSSLPQVAEVKIVPAAEALADFQARFANEPEILAAINEVGENPLSDALTITAKQAQDLPFLLQAVKTPEFSSAIRETVADDDIIAALKTLSAWTARIRTAGLLLAAFFGLIATMIVYNAIRMGIYVHREEIAVMRLVGAKNVLIRGPFLVEVAVYAGLAVLVSGGLTMVAAATFEPTLTTFFAGIDIGLVRFFRLYATEIFGLQFLVLYGLSALATIIAMRKYLKT
jgi:cell division transport system permease protein